MSPFDLRGSGSGGSERPTPAGEARPFTGLPTLRASIETLEKTVNARGEVVAPQKDPLAQLAQDYGEEEEVTGEATDGMDTEPAGEVVMEEKDEEEDDVPQKEVPEGTCIEVGSPVLPSTPALISVSKLGFWMNYTWFP